MFNLIECTIQDIKTAFQKNELTSYELTKMYLDRIATIDQGNPKYNSILEVNPDALYEARIKDQERQHNKAKGILHGIPVVLKDNINTIGKMHTTAGSLALQDTFAPYDAEITRRLKEEGAIILGKANLTEFANFMTIGMRNGYSSLGKQVLCPYNTAVDPSGSSAGSAVSVTLNLTPISIGTETGGSIMSPSMQNGVVGLKPTMGLVSRTGIVPISSTLDTAGPMGKYVADVALLLSAIRSNDPEDPITNEKPDNKVNYTKDLDKKDPKSFRIGLNLDNYDKLSPNRKTAFKNLVDRLQKAGVEIVDDIKVEQSTRIYHVMLYEFKRVFNHYLSTLGNRSKYTTLRDIVEFNRDNQKEALKYGQVILEEVLYKTSGRCNESNYIEALTEREYLTKALNKIFEEHKLDILYFANYTSLGPHCGFPTMTVPIGKDELDIPIGTYLLAKKYDEQTLLQVGQLIERLIKGRINPISK
jgi:amidase